MSKEIHSIAFAFLLHIVTQCWFFPSLKSSTGKKWHRQKSVQAKFNEPITTRCHDSWHVDSACNLPNWPSFTPTDSGWEVHWHLKFGEKNPRRKALQLSANRRLFKVHIHFAAIIFQRDPSGACAILARQFGWYIVAYIICFCSDGIRSSAGAHIPKLDCLIH